MEHSSYLIQPQYYQERTENSVLQDVLTEKWELIEDINLHANISPFLWYDTQNQDFIFIETMFSQDKTHLMSNNVISSAFLLYRLISMGYTPNFPKNGIEQVAYKSLWSISLEHKKTGQKLNLYDFKGGWNIGTIYSEPDEMPYDFKEDLLRLMNFLISNDIVHPYDLTVSGSVA